MGLSARGQVDRVLATLIDPYRRGIVELFAGAAEDRGRDSSHPGLRRVFGIAYFQDLLVSAMPQIAVELKIYFKDRDFSNAQTRRN